MNFRIPNSREEIPRANDSQAHINKTSYNDHAIGGFPNGNIPTCNDANVASRAEIMP
jgi:hypothetical protein